MGEIDPTDGMDGLRDGWDGLNGKKMHQLLSTQTHRDRQTDTRIFCLWLLLLLSDALNSKGALFLSGLS